MERGADLAWLMDDDGVPEPDCLATLLTRDGPRLLGAARWWPSRTPTGCASRSACPAAPAWCTRWRDVEAAAADGLIRDVVIPFNGVLVTTRAGASGSGCRGRSSSSGATTCEYLWRAQRAGARIGTVVDAHVLHPAIDDLGTPMMFGRTTYNHTPSDLKHYCMARNNPLNLREYRGWPHVLMFWRRRSGSTCSPSRSRAGSR